jgi:hypothetical protein
MLTIFFWGILRYLSIFKRAPDKESAQRKPIDAGNLARPTQSWAFVCFFSDSSRAQSPNPRWFVAFLVAFVTSGHAPYRFALDDSSAWRKHLEDEGYVVLARAMTPDEVKTAKDLLWTVSCLNRA